MSQHIRRAHPTDAQQAAERRERPKTEPFPAFVLTGDGNRVTQPNRSSND